MPIHDWSRVDAGVFHHLHLNWIARLDASLNGGLLPPPFYALAEPAIGEAIPDVITLQAADAGDPGAHVPKGLEFEDDKTQAIQRAPGGVLVQDLPAMDAYALLARRIVIKDELRGDRVVAVIELVSHGNKASQRARTQFLDKTVELLREGIHLVLIDIRPPTAVVPSGFHRLLCDVLGEAPSDSPVDRPLQAVSYEVLESGTIRSHVAPLAVGDAMPEMPLFLLPHRFVRLPLQSTYDEAFQTMPRRFAAVLEAR